MKAQEHRKVIPERVSCMKTRKSSASLRFLSPNTLDSVVNIFRTQAPERLQPESVDGTKEHPTDALNPISICSSTEQVQKKLLAFLEERGVAMSLQRFRTPID
jgi:hypothetical protein